MPRSLERARQVASARPHPDDEPERVVPPGPLTYEEFLDWADEDSLAEWVDGEIILSSPASVDHHDLTTFLYETLDTFVVLHKLGKVMIAPFQMKLPNSGREPDVLFISTAKLPRLRHTYLDGPADLVVEIVSPESVTRDRVVKLQEYSEGGVGEYWLLDPRTRQADMYVRLPGGPLERVPFAAGDIFQSRVVPGFWLRYDWLWQEPLPDVADVMLEIDGEAYVSYLQEKFRQAGR